MPQTPNPERRIAADSSPFPGGETGWGPPFPGFVIRDYETATAISDPTMTRSVRAAKIPRGT